jgi:cyclopropane fatty-acyl-phospholipid synthase-like methyltransferase
VTYAETDLVATIERLAGKDLAALTQPQRDQLDQFHSGGAEAVDRLLPSLDVAPGMTVLDIGSGLGGPARQIARSSGCTVVGVDLTPAYVDTARALTHTEGLDDQVTFVCSDIAALDRFDFDAAYTMHVQMNVAEKKTYFTEIARRLRPGAHFATFEVCLTGRTQPTPPLPWSLDGTDSYLATAAELRDTIASSGFEILEWVDETQWVLQWFENLGKRMAAGGSPATLPALLNDGPTRMMNFAVALTTGVVSVHRGSFILANVS